LVRGRPAVRYTPPPKARVLRDLMNLGDLCARSGRRTGTGGWSYPGSRPTSIPANLDPHCDAPLSVSLLPAPANEPVFPLATVSRCNWTLTRVRRTARKIAGGRCVSGSTLSTGFGLVAAKICHCRDSGNRNETGCYMTRSGFCPSCVNAASTWARREAWFLRLGGACNARARSLLLDFYAQRQPEDHEVPRRFAMGAPSGPDGADLWADWPTDR
jgi:hypothetical protein